MEPDEEEQILEGGNMSTVVRVGDTVRRGMTHASDAVHALLLHLEAVKFRGAPRFLGIDSAGREILSFIPGEVGCAPYPLPAYMWSGDSLIGAGKLLREFHDAAQGFRPSEDAIWLYGRGRPSASELVCHNDIAPYNTVFVDQRPVAFIDWDLAGPAEPIMDIAHALIYYLPVAPEIDAENAGVPEPSRWRGRLRAFCDAYGLDDRSGILDAMLERQRATIDGFIRHAAEEDARFERLISEGHLDAQRSMFEWLEGHVAELAKELT